MVADNVGRTNAGGDGSEARLVIDMDPDLAHRFAAFRCRNQDFVSVEEAARHILRLWLTENGYDGMHSDDGRRPEALNASNDD